MLRSVRAVVKPWYHQFYLRRGDAPWASDAVSDAGYEAGAEAIDGFVYIGVEMYGSPTDVIVEVFDDEPSERESVEHSAQLRIDGSGPLAILSWGDDEPVATVEVPVGPLSARVDWIGTAEAAVHPDREIGGEVPSPESVHLQVWPTGS